MTTIHAAKQWFVNFRPNPRAGVRLFCFPYAGGGASVFRTWPADLPSYFEVYAAQLPGRGARMAESPFTHISAMVASIADGLRPHLSKPFAFFGHSMGAIIGFELARLLRREGRPGPFHLFVSGHAAPQLPDTSRRTYDLPEQELIEELRRLNGTPPEVLAQPELMQLMLPILRADFEVCQTYECSTEPPLDCPVTVFGGMDDVETGRERLEPWREQTSAPFSLKMLPGDHFFLNGAQSQILRVIDQQSQSSMRRRA